MLSTEYWGIEHRVMGSGWWVLSIEYWGIEYWVIENWGIEYWVIDYWVMGCG